MVFADATRIAGILDAQAPAAVLVSLSALPAMLTSPLLRAALAPLAWLQAAETPAAACSMPMLCRATLVSVQSVSVRCGPCLGRYPSVPAGVDGSPVRCRRVHALCHQPLLRASLGLEDMFNDGDGSTAQLEACTQQVVCSLKQAAVPSTGCQVKVSGGHVHAGRARR